MTLFRHRPSRPSRERPRATATPVYASEASGFGSPADPNVRRLADPERPCSGCAHSASGAPFPGHPSGERPCGFCVRNPDLAPGEVADWFGERGPVWYDATTPPWKTPMDCYIATDRLQQQRIFDALDELKRTGREVPPRERFEVHPFSGTDDAWCCEGGDAPGGHTWTCWRWLGMSFG